MPSSIMEKYESMEYGPAPEDASEVTKWLDARGRSFGHFIDGKHVDSAAKGRFTVTNPATGSPLSDSTRPDR